MRWHVLVQTLPVGVASGVPWAQWLHRLGRWQLLPRSTPDAHNMAGLKETTWNPTESVLRDCLAMLATNKMAQRQLMLPLPCSHLPHPHPSPRRPWHRPWHRPIRPSSQRQSQFLRPAHLHSTFQFDAVACLASKNWMLDTNTCGKPWP